eukprot:SAG11_NODE_81_length_17673_cov_7.702572_20_plen_106_part_00
MGDHCEHFEYLLGNQGVPTCPSGYVAITTASQCQTACGALSIRYNGQQSNWGTGYPQGCFINTGDPLHPVLDGSNQGCLINTGAGGSAWECSDCNIARIICFFNP